MDNYIVKTFYIHKEDFKDARSKPQRWHQSWFRLIVCWTKTFWSKMPLNDQGERWTERHHDHPHISCFSVISAPPTRLLMCSSWPPGGRLLPVTSPYIPTGGQPGHSDTTRSAESTWVTIDYEWFMSMEDVSPMDIIRINFLTLLISIPL